MPRKIVNPFTGIEIIPEIDHDGRIEKIVERQPISGTKKAMAVQEMINWETRRARPNTQHHRKHVAEIPNVVVGELMRDGVWWDDTAMKKWLDGPGSGYKTTTGRLS